jgi:hypothetical protein
VERQTESVKGFFGGKGSLTSAQDFFETPSFGMESKTISCNLS